MHLAPFSQIRENAGTVVALLAPSNDDELREEVLRARGRAHQIGCYLDKLHIFMLAHVMRRPIVVYHYDSGQPRGSTISGIYLPDLWEELGEQGDGCSRVPLSLVYTGGTATNGLGHFTACVGTEGRALVLPLSDHVHGERLLIRYGPDQVDMDGPTDNWAAHVALHLELTCAAASDSGDLDDLEEAKPVAPGTRVRSFPFAFVSRTPADSRLMLRSVAELRDQFVAEVTGSAAVERRIAPDGAADGASDDDGVADEQADEDDGSVPAGDEDDEDDEQADEDDGSVPAWDEDEEDDEQADNSASAAADFLRRGVQEPKTAFAYFRVKRVNSNRLKGLDWVEMKKELKELEKEWEELSAADKEPYEAQAAKSKVKHDLELAAWQAAGGADWPRNAARMAMRRRIKLDAAHRAMRRQIKQERKARQVAKQKAQQLAVATPMPPSPSGSSSSSSAGGDTGLSNYERERDKQVLDNNAKLKELGLHEPLFKKPASKAAGKKRAPPKPEAAAAALSHRPHDHHVHGAPPATPAEAGIAPPA